MFVGALNAARVARGDVVLHADELRLGLRGQVRRLLASTATASDKVAALAQLATELGLEPSTPLEPLPEVDEDDVHLVCWLAIVPPA